MSKKGQSWGRAVYKVDRDLYNLEKPYMNQPHICYRLPVKPATELYEKPLPAPTLICLPCCAILACSQVGISDEKFVIQMNP